jgi:hypothetical protein
MMARPALRPGDLLLGFVIFVALNPVVWVAVYFIIRRAGWL